MTADLRPERQTLLVLRGSTFAQPYAFVDADDEPLDITGWTIEGSINTLGALTDAGALSMTFDRTDDETGVGTLRIPGFEALLAGSYSFYVRYTDAAGTTAYAGLGTIRISDESP